jgi:hypothetical protein
VSFPLVRGWRFTAESAGAKRARVQGAYLASIRLNCQRNHCAAGRTRAGCETLLIRGGEKLRVAT